MCFAAAQAPDQLPVLQSIARWEEELGNGCAHEFMQLVRDELLGTRVFVFTEAEGSTRILNLARGATLGEAASVLRNASDAGGALEVALLNGVTRRPSSVATCCVSPVKSDQGELGKTVQCKSLPWRVNVSCSASLMLKATPSSSNLILVPAFHPGWIGSWKGFPLCFTVLLPPR